MPIFDVTATPSPRIVLYPARFMRAVLWDFEVGRRQYVNGINPPSTLNIVNGNCNLTGQTPHSGTLAKYTRRHHRVGGYMVYRQLARG